MHLEREHELEEGSELNVWKIYGKDDVLIVFELDVSEEETDELLAVYLASFQRASLEKRLARWGERPACLHFDRIWQNSDRLRERIEQVTANG